MENTNWYISLKKLKFKKYVCDVLQVTLVSSHICQVNFQYWGKVKGKLRNLTYKTDE